MLFKVIQYDLSKSNNSIKNGTLLHEFSDLNIAKTYINTFVNVLFDNCPSVYSHLILASNEDRTSECYYLTTPNECIAFTLVPDTFGDKFGTCCGFTSGVPEVDDFNPALFTCIVATRYNEKKESFKYAVIMYHYNGSANGSANGSDNGSDCGITPVSTDVAIMNTPQWYTVVSLHNQYSNAFDAASEIAGKLNPALYTNNGILPLVFNARSGIVGIMPLA